MNVRENTGFAILLFAASVDVVGLAHGQAPVITSFDRNGVLEWSNSQTSGWYGVEWASSMTGVWHRGWVGMDALPANGGVMRTDVPIYYRVAWMPDWPWGWESITVTGEILASASEEVSSYHGTLANTPLVPGSVVINGGSLTWTDNGDGTLSGAAGVDGTIDYATGTWAVDLKSNRIDDGEIVSAAYRYTSGGWPSDPRFPDPEAGAVTGEVVAVGSSDRRVYSGTVDQSAIVEGSFVLQGGGLSWTDWDDGVLHGPTGTVGVLVYHNGAWMLDLGTNRLADGVMLRASYGYTSSRHLLQEMGWLPHPVTGEVLATVSGEPTIYSGVLRERPVAGSLSIRGGTLSWADDGAGTLTGTCGTDGTVNYSTGAWRIDLKDNRIPTGFNITAKYGAGPEWGDPNRELSMSECIAFCSGGVGSYALVLFYPYIRPGSLTVTTGGLQWHDMGDGTLIGAAGMEGTVDYATGRVTIDMGWIMMADGEAIIASYRYGYPTIAVRDKIIGYGVSGRTAYSGTIDNKTLKMGSVVITAQTFVFTDLGQGTLVGSVGTSGTIDCGTGKWALDLKGYQFADGTPIIAQYEVLLPQ